MDDPLRYGYAVYCGKCKQNGVEPVSFREWAKISMEYDIEWTAAKIESYESEHGTGEK